MKFAIAQLEDVRAFYAGEKIRVRFYANGKEVAKAAATEFTVSGSERVYEEPVVEKDPADMTVDELAAELQDFAPTEAKTRKLRSDTKAAAIRSKIEELIANEEFDVAKVVDFAVEKLSMKKSLALVYVKNNVAKLQSVSAA